MSYRIIEKLPNVKEIIAATPMSPEGYANILKHREEIKAILRGDDKRLICVVGPCSAWPDTAVLEYARRLVLLNQKVSKNLKIIMRSYIQKPRTIKGWTGPVNQPDPLSPPNVAEGIKYARGLMVKINEMGLPIADEALFTHNAEGFLELLSWVAIGARSSEDQEHRIHASAIDCPVGMKNPTHGSLKIGVNSIVAATNSHIAVFDGHAIETTGNPYAHLVLRGGNGKPNYSIEHIMEAHDLLNKAQVDNPAIMVDVSHDNCLVNGKKDYFLQPQIIFDILDSIKDKPELKKLIKGFMIESFLKSGNQNIDTAEVIDFGGLSITDPCISFEETEELLLKLSRRLANDN
jgi:3-deoxy-7-phosphoheptulonate synthase